jgi:hypothetical protein
MKSKMKFSRQDPSYGTYDKWREICPEGPWKNVSPDVLHAIIPASLLLSKTNSVLIMASGSATSSVFVANMNRVDAPASAIDQEPYIAVFDHSASAASGGFVHHGDWPNRTTLPGEGFFDGISASGIQAYYPLAQMPTAGSGHLNELKVDSQNAAFWTALSELRNSGK